MKVDIATLQSMAGQCRSEAADTSSRHAHLSSSINSSVLDGWTDSQAAAQAMDQHIHGAKRRALAEEG